MPQKILSLGILSLMNSQIHFIVLMFFVVATMLLALGLLDADFFRIFRCIWVVLCGYCHSLVRDKNAVVKFLFRMLFFYQVLLNLRCCKSIKYFFTNV